MTFIGTETQPPVNQSQTGSYNVSHASPLQPQELSSVGRLCPSTLENFPLKPFLIFSFLYSSFPHIPRIPSLFCDDLIPAAPLPPFLPPPTPPSLHWLSLLPPSFPMKSESSSALKRHCRPSSVISFTRLRGAKCLNQFHNYPSVTPLSLFFLLPGCSRVK